MTRIKSDNINLGKSFVVSTEEDFIAEQELQRKRLSIIESTQEEAQTILNNAKEQAQSIVDNAVDDAKIQSEQVIENAKKEGFQAGYNDGYKEGREQIEQELKDKIINVDNFAKSTFELKKRIIKSAHKDIIELVRIIADKVCHKNFEKDNEIFEAITKAAIELLKEKESVNIIVNPKMANKIWEISESLKAQIQGLENIKIIEDASVGTDGTIVESVKNRIDCTLENQIKTIIDEMYNELNFTSEEKLVEETDND